MWSKNCVYIFQTKKWQKERKSQTCIQKWAKQYFVITLHDYMPHNTIIKTIDKKISNAHTRTQGEHTKI